MTSIFAPLIARLFFSIFYRSQIEHILPNVNINTHKRHGGKQWIEFHIGDKVLVIFNIDLIHGWNCTEDNAGKVQDYSFYIFIAIWLLHGYNFQSNLSSKYLMNCYVNVICSRPFNWLLNVVLTFYRTEWKVKYSLGIMNVAGNM